MKTPLIYLVPALICLSAASWLTPRQAWAANEVSTEDTAELVRLAPEKKRIPHLVFPDSELPLELDSSHKKAWAIVRGKFQRAHWKLLLKSDVLKTDTDGGFEIKVPLEAANTQVTLTSVGPKGETLSENLKVQVTTWKDLFNPDLKRAPKKWTVTPSLGISSIAFTQSEVEDLSQIALTGKVSGLYILKRDEWDLGANAFVTIAPLSVRSLTQHGARFLGVNFRLGRWFKALPSPWKTGIMLGGYYTTMLVPERAYGYRDMGGPQAFAVIGRDLSKGNSVSSYLKFAPIAQSFGLLALGSSEIATGASYSHPLKNGHVVSVALDYARLAIQVETVSIRSNSLSLSGAYSF